MTVRRLIKQLMDFPMDSQVVDSGGSPIMYMLFHSKEYHDVRLEAKRDMDVDAELDALFKNAEECAESDYDTYDELCELGYTLKDLKDYNKDVYEWALRMNEEKGDMREQ